MKMKLIRPLSPNTPRFRQFFYSLLFLFTLLSICYSVFFVLGMDWNILLVKIKAMLLVRSLHFLFSWLGWGGSLILGFILSCFDDWTNLFMMEASGSSGGSNNPVRGENQMGENSNMGGNSGGSGWTSFDLGVLAEPFPDAFEEGEEVAQPNAPANPVEEIRAQEHDRIYRTVEGITEACEEEERAVIDKAHRLLQRKGIVLEDPTDVRRALGTALYDSWQTDIDHRLPHFRRIQQDFGTNRCCIWNLFVDELRDLGNPQVNARHKVD